MAAMEENARENPRKTLDVKLAIAEDDLVAVHSHVAKTLINRARLSSTSFGLKRIVSWNSGILDSLCLSSLQTITGCSK